MKDGYYECNRCPRWFKIVNGREIKVSAKEALEYNVTLLKKGECQHNKIKNTVKPTQKAYNEKKIIQDNSRYHSYR